MCGGDEGRASRAPARYHARAGKCFHRSYFPPTAMKGLVPQGQSRTLKR